MGNIQVPEAVVMIRPSSFGFNEQTAGSNAFQSAVKQEPEVIREKAREEFDALVRELEAAAVTVYAFDDLPEQKTPDAVFPNNWISFHPDGSVILYPMLAPNRRKERRLDIPEVLRKHYRMERIIDLTGHEAENRYLEGTGSIVFDHINKIAYANRSPRTDEGLLNKLCEAISYEPCVFDAFDRDGNEIYHTNVLMTIGDGFSVVCTRSIPEKDRNRIAGLLKETDHEVIEISYEQMEHFAGNMIQLRGGGENFLVMSRNANNILQPEQKSSLERFGRLLNVPLGTIETYGGGSARCMIAGIHLPLRA